MMLSICQWLQSTSFFTALRGSWYIYPTVMSLHLVFIAMFGGLVLMTNMRLLGWGMRNRPIADVVNQFRIPKRIGLILVATCGILMFGSKAEEYYYNSFFRLKMLLLALMFVHGWVFRRGVYEHPAEMDRTPPGPPGRAKLAAILSLLLWAAIACAGRGIGYIEPPLNRLHAILHAPQPAKRVVLALKSKGN